MAAPFPTPSPVIVDALDQLRLAAAEPPKSDKELRLVAMLPRPWDPASCPSELRSLIYTWFDAVVGWINEEHTWRLDRVVPICWSQHPHIVHEIATLACLRWEADYAVTAGPLEDWHRYTLPLFLGRVGDCIGSTWCPPGKHQPHPGTARHALYRSDGAVRTRRRTRHADDSSQTPTLG